MFSWEETGMNEGPTTASCIQFKEMCVGYTAWTTKNTMTLLTTSVAKVTLQAGRSSQEQSKFIYHTTQATWKKKGSSHYAYLLHISAEKKNLMAKSMWFNYAHSRISPNEIITSQPQHVTAELLMVLIIWYLHDYRAVCFVFTRKQLTLLCLLGSVYPLLCNSTACFITFIIILCLCHHGLLWKIITE